MAENTEVVIFECSYFIGRRMFVSPKQWENTGIGYWLPPCFKTLTYLYAPHDTAVKNDTFPLFSLKTCIMGTC